MTLAACRTRNSDDRIAYQQLTSLGYMVQAIADNGEDALQLALELRPALIYMDISLRGGADGVRVAQRQLRDTERRRALVYQRAFHGILSVGADGTIVENNEASARIFDRSGSLVGVRLVDLFGVGLPFEELVHPPHQERSLVLPTGRSLTVEIEVVRTDEPTWTFFCAGHPRADAGPAGDGEGPKCRPGVGAGQKRLSGKHEP